MFSEELLLDDLARTADPDLAVNNMLIFAGVGIIILLTMIVVYKYINRKDEHR